MEVFLGREGKMHGMVSKYSRYSLPLPRQKSAPTPFFTPKPVLFTYIFQPLYVNLKIQKFQLKYFIILFNFLYI